MSRIELAPEVGDDIDRIFDHLALHQIDNIPNRIDEIIQAISVLKLNPLIGRPVRKARRELVIGKRLHGYLALYQYVQEIDTVFILTIRGQKEAGYSG